MRIDKHKGPNKRCQHQYDINERQKIILQTKLNGRESKIKDNVKNKRRKDSTWYFFLYIQECHISKRKSDDDIKNSPHRSKHPSRWSPFGFDELLIPSTCKEFCIHTILLTTRLFSLLLASTTHTPQLPQARQQD